MENNNTIELILSKASLVDIASRYVTVKKRGSKFACKCPFHNDKTPSLYFSEDVQLFHCFGCGKSGNVINFVSEIENISKKDAVIMLAEELGINYSSASAEEYRRQNEKRKAEVDLNHQFMLECQANLKIQESVMRYLKSVRDIQNNKTIKDFKLGFCSTPTFNPQFQNRLIIPFTDIRGKVVGFTARQVDGFQYFTNQGKYINSHNNEVFNKTKHIFNLKRAKDSAQTKQAGTIYITEGQFDVIQAHDKGIENIVAVSGSAVAEEQLNTLSRYVDTLVFVFDNDEAGKKAYRQVLKLSHRIPSVSFLAVRLEYKDLDEQIRQKSRNTSDFGLSHTIPLWQMVLENIRADAPNEKQAFNLCKDAIKNLHPIEKRDAYIWIKNEFRVGGNLKFSSVPLLPKIDIKDTMEEVVSILYRLALNIQDTHQELYSQITQLFSIIEDDPGKWKGLADKPTKSQVFRAKNLLQQAKNPKYRELLLEINEILNSKMDF